MILISGIWSASSTVWLGLQPKLVEERGHYGGRPGSLQGPQHASEKVLSGSSIPASESGAGGHPTIPAFSPFVASQREGSEGQRDAVRRVRGFSPRLPAWLIRTERLTADKMSYKVVCLKQTLKTFGRGRTAVTTQGLLGQLSWHFCFTDAYRKFEKRSRHERGGPPGNPTDNHPGVGVFASAPLIVENIDQCPSSFPEPTLMCSNQK